MPRQHRAPFVALINLVQRQHPELGDPAAAVTAGLIVVNGRSITNPRARVRSDSSIRVDAPRRLRGETKLLTALDAFGVDVTGTVAVDVGAAAGGFTTALLGRGAVRVYAVDVGYGQLRGRLRSDPRVVNLEHTNVSLLNGRLVPDTIDVVTVDLSYLAVADAVLALEALRLAPDASLVALVKPTFELRAASVLTDPEGVRRAIRVVVDSLDRSKWRAVACTLPSISGAHGAVEAFILADRHHPGIAAASPSD